MKLNNKFLPITKQDLKERNIEQLDFIIITGDAYVDHPSFGTAIIGRTLEYEGFTVGVIAQPNWNDVEAFRVLGEPKYAFLINSGNMDSMVNHYTAAKKKRNTDLFSPGGEIGHRPDRAVISYCSKARQAYKGVPIIIGGIEASLRRFVHYDYWDNKLRRSILIDSKADLLIYGMGEKTVSQIANLLKYGMNIKNITNVRGTVYATNTLENVDDYIEVPSFEECVENTKAFAESFKLEYLEQDSINGKNIVQKHDNRYIVQNKPQVPLTEEEMDVVYNFPYTRTYHPTYESKGGIPAIREVKFSITSHRGCFGGCSFCALNFHQGRTIQHRSQNSVIEEAKLLTTLKDFKGYIHDVGGPTANFRHTACEKQKEKGVCKNRQCLFPTPCKNLKANHREYLDLLRKIRKLPNIKKVFIRSGIRFDYLVEDKDTTFFRELCEHHISGQLKVAPEHINDKVLKLMGKPKNSVYEKFEKTYFEINKKLDKKQFLVPYLISSHPGSDLNIAIELAIYIKNMGHTPEQVQDFYPTPGSLSTAMYYTGINPLTGENVYIPKTFEEKSMQRALLQFSIPENYNLVKKALIKAHREDLIGFGSNCLIPPYPPKNKKGKIHTNNSSNKVNKKSNTQSDKKNNFEYSTENKSKINKKSTPKPNKNKFHSKSHSKNKANKTR
ncbi:YgiQ family radical SAM protein [Clostridium sp. MB40-C1]|uniref:YgiQ family radical SAM protein n=1 Tax=Clostridium sp. MB40-C1 TaxID=3070996 RepID=UPI0027DECAE0|nr:YgiQ family radical SAM protein [Clostridium sp. MB40-C1]WMJ80609.1 YgiQ family radical SAM protein [Clostridium sp. MB40-C1]